MINDKANDFIGDIFQSHLSRYQVALETSVKGNDFIFTCVH